MKKLLFLLFLLSPQISWATNYCTSTYGAQACWLFKEGSGSTVADSAGNGNSGTFNTTTWENTSLPGKSYITYAADYAGSTGNVSGGTVAALFPYNSAWSETTWIYLTSTVTGTQPRIMDKSSGTQGPTVQVNISGGSGVIQFAVAGGTQLIVITSTTLSLNAWHHVAVTWDGSTTAANVHIYIDGTEASYTTQTNGATLTNNNSQNFLLGNRNTNDTQVWKGHITEMGIFNQVLTSGQVSDIYNFGLLGNNISVTTINNAVLRNATID